MKKTLATLTACAAVVGGALIATPATAATLPAPIPAVSSSTALDAPKVLGSLRSGNMVRLTGTGTPGAFVSVEYAGWDFSARVSPSGTWISSFGLFDDERAVSVSQSLGGQRSASTTYVIPIPTA